MKRRLSPAQRAALENLVNGRYIAHGISGMSAHGGLSQTLVSLHRHKLIDRDEQITDAGRAALEGKGK